ncbi:hypothetical protein [Nonomuraea sp. NPDC050783]|uniref:hypothetical protein n=1 Tax=Nonomuraea sp. NPDC050783 TaxID=3154634 RepID=UPI003465D835
MRQIAVARPALTKAWADSAHRTSVIEGAVILGIDLEAVREDPAAKGFTPLPRRWVAERTFGRLVPHPTWTLDQTGLNAHQVASCRISI